VAAEELAAVGRREGLEDLDGKSFGQALEEIAELQGGLQEAP
jgi:hypothetical protein